MAFKARRYVGGGARQQKVGGIRRCGAYFGQKLSSKLIPVIFASLSLLDAEG
jgi:hypothetical protein